MDRKYIILFILLALQIAWSVYTYLFTVKYAQDLNTFPYTLIPQIVRRSPASKQASFTRNDVLERVFSSWRLQSAQDGVLALRAKGRWGNIMFEYASLLGIAYRNRKRPVFLSKDHILREVFNVSFLGELDTYFWTEKWEQNYASYEPEFENLPDGNVTISQYFQSWKYFEPIKRQLRKEFALVKNYEELGKEVFINSTSHFRKRVLVAVHVRRDKLDRKQGYTVAPLSYIHNAMSHMKSKFKSPAFLVSTDDPNWCEKHLRAPDVTIIHNEDPIIDMAALTMCNHTIMTVGTFGWWVAWIINGHTVYYVNYPIPGREVDVGFNRNDFFLQHWVGIGD